MAIGVLSRKFLTQTRGATELDILFGCIGEKLKAKSTIYFEQATILSSDNRGYFNPDPTTSGKVYNDDLWWVEDGNFFNDCQVGDTIIFRSQLYPTDPEVTDTIVEILGGGLARMANTYTQRLLDGGAIYNATAMKSVIYQYGLSTGGYNSLIDDSLQKYILNSSGSTSLISITPANAVGNKDWQFKTTELLITGNGATPSFASQSIIVEHEFVVMPLFLTGEYDDLAPGLAPDRFKADNIIRYRSILDYNKSSVLGEIYNEITFEDIGQFGWFNTKFDGSNSPYTLTSLQFKRLDSSTANQLEYEAIEVKFTLNSSTNSFDSSDTALVFGFNYLPSDQSYYQNTNRTAQTNFAFDSKRLIADGTLVNGDNFGTGLQIIKNIEAEVLSSSSCQVTVNIEIGADQLPILQQGEIAQYALWCIVENTDLDPELSDKSNVLIDVNYIYVQKTKIDLLDNDTLFIEHPYDTLQYSVTELEMFPVDDVVANNLITLDYTGLENDGIILKSVRPQIVLKHADEADIILDSEFISLENYPTVGSAPAVQNIAFQKNRPYKIENGIRKTITMYRNYALDSGNTKAWLLSFPFMNRWEYWIRLIGLNNIPSDLFDNTVPFGGANHLWNRIVNASDWTLVYRTTFEIIQNGEDFEQVFEQELTSTNFNSNTDWSDCVIESHDLDTDAEITVGPKKYVYAQKNTLIRAKFTKSTGVVPDLDGVYMVIWAESFEGGGITEIKNIDSGRDVIPSSPFTGINGTKRVSITKNINTFTGEVVLDFSKLPIGQKITVYARIYEYQSGDPEDGRVTEDFILRMTLDGQIRLVD